MKEYHIEITNHLEEKKLVAVHAKNESQAYDKAFEYAEAIGFIPLNCPEASIEIVNGETIMGFLNNLLGE